MKGIRQTATPQHPSILLVDNSTAVRQSLYEWLGVIFPQCNLYEAASGEQALTLTQTCTPEIVVIDIELPHMSGIQATRQIKQALPKTQIIMLSIHEDPHYRIDAMQAGAAFYVSKQLVTPTLISVVAELLSQLQDTANDSRASSAPLETIPLNLPTKRQPGSSYPTPSPEI